MMKIDAIHVWRRGGENDPNAEVVVQVCDSFDGSWRELGTEKLDGNFSTIWELPLALIAKPVDA